MNNREFALAMLEYEELYRKLKELEDKIIPHVLELKSTQSIGNVTAKYSKGRTSYDYERVKDEYNESITPYIVKHTKVVEKIDWRSICKDLDYDPPIDKEPVPYVKLEVKD